VVTDQERDDKMMEWLAKKGAPFHENVRVRASPSHLYARVREGDVLVKTLKDITVGRGWDFWTKYDSLHRLKKAGKITYYHNGVTWHIAAKELARPLYRFGLSRS